MSYDYDDDYDDHYDDHSLINLMEFIKINEIPRYEWSDLN